MTLLRGIDAVLEELRDLLADVGVTLSKSAQAFTGISGSTYGTLLATALMSAAKITKGQKQVPWSQISFLLNAALEAMMKRGNGQLGDKTVLDALESAKVATAGLDEPISMLKAVQEALSATIEQFRSRPAKQGRARIFGEKSIGLDDAGMVAFQRIVACLQEAS